MREGQICVLIRYTVGKPLSLEGEGNRVQCLLRENEKTRRWSIAEDASESTKASKQNEVGAIRNKGKKSCHW